MRAEAENQPKLPPQARFGNPAAPQKPQQRQQKHDADDAAEQAVRPFPPVDRLERFEAHAAVERAVLRDRLIFFKLALPLRITQRRDDAQHRLPLGDGKPGFGQPRRTADQHHGEHQCGDRQQPYPDRTNVHRALPNVIR